MLLREIFGISSCLIILFWEGADSLLNLADTPCGLQRQRTDSERRNPKIVASFLSKPRTYPGEFPWMVSIKYRDGDHFCGGFIISRSFILSAAHCFNSISEKFTTLGMMTATVGEHHVHEREEPLDAIDLDFAKIILHPNYDSYSLSHDIVLLKLEKPIEWSPFVQPLCLPDPEQQLGGGSARRGSSPGSGSSSSSGVSDDSESNSKLGSGTVAGWGRTGEKEPPSSVLLQATLPILDNPTCQKYFDLAQFKFVINKFQFCAGKFFGGVDTCLGDSGGPLMIREKTGGGGGGGGATPGSIGPGSEEQMSGIGIVSFGKGCGRVSLPGVYTRVKDYIPWIKAQVATQ